jgi:hypothetical protein
MEVRFPGLLEAGKISQDSMEASKLSPDLMEAGKLHQIRWKWVSFPKIRWKQESCSDLSISFYLHRNRGCKFKARFQTIITKFIDV